MRSNGGGIQERRVQALATKIPTKRPEFLQSLMNEPPRFEPEVEEAERALKEMRGAVPTPMLDVVFRDGKMRSFSYSTLDEVEFDPGDTVTLRYISGRTVVLEGRNLMRLRQSLRLHRADEVRECRESEGSADGEQISQVEHITITEGEMR